MAVGYQGGSSANPNAFAGDTLNINPTKTGSGGMYIGNISTGPTIQNPGAITGGNTMDNTATMPS